MYSLFTKRASPLPLLRALGTVSSTVAHGEHVITASNPSSRNALSVNMLRQMHYSLRKMPKTSRAVFDFDTTHSRVSCAGFNLFDFDVKAIAKGTDPLPPSHPGCLLLEEVYQRSKSQPVEFIINKHLVGFGLVLAAAANTISWGNPTDIKVFLPHFRVGIGFPLLPIFVLMERFGVSTVVNLLLQDRAIPLSELLNETQKERRLPQQQKVALIQQACARLKNIAKTSPQSSRTLTQPDVATLHIDQIRLFLEYGSVEYVPPHLHEFFESRRQATAGRSLADSISRHRGNMAEVNDRASKDLRK